MYPASDLWVLAFWNTRSTSGLVIAFILAVTATGLVILLGGGTKKRQQADISEAILRWHDYKQRKKQEMNKQ